MNGGDATQSDNNGVETGSNQGSEPAANPDAQPGLFPAPPLPHSENSEPVPNFLPGFQRGRTNNLMNPGGSTGSNSSSNSNSLNNTTNSSANLLSAPASSSSSSSSSQSNDLPPGLYPELPKNPSNGSVEMPKTLGEQQALEQNPQATVPTNTSNSSTAPPSLFSGAAGGLLNRQLQGFSSIGAALRSGSLGHSFSTPQIAPARPVLHSNMHANHSPAPAHPHPHPHPHQKPAPSNSVQHHQPAPQLQPSEMIDRYTVDQY